MSFFRRKAASRVVLLAVGCSVLFGCPTPEEPDLLADAEALCRDQRYEEALPILKTLLLREPENAGAHYYLGQCFMLQDDFRPRMAIGEFETALRLFEEQGGVSPIERFLPRYFEMMCSVDSAKATIFEVQNLVEKGVAPRYVRPVIARGERFIEAARAVNPSAEEIAYVDQFLSAMSNEHRRRERLPRNGVTRSL